MVTDIVLRTPTLDDAEEVVRLINDESTRLTGSSDREADVDEVRGWWTQPPPFDLARDVCVAVAESGIVGYGDLGDPGTDGAIFWLDVRGPAAADVLPELERRARERARPGGVVRAIADSTDDRLAALLAGRGYTTIRASYRMIIELEGRTFVPVLPESASVRGAHPSEEDELLYSLGQQSFADHWGFVPQPFEEWRHWFREVGEPDPTLWFVAEVSGEPVGLALCRPTMHGNADGGWISTLGVLPAFRGRGLGTALLVHAFGEFRRRGRRRVGLGVDAENTTGAVRLYERGGMRVIRRWDIWERAA